MAQGTVMASLHIYPVSPETVRPSFLRVRVWLAPKRPRFPIQCPGVSGICTSYRGELRELPYFEVLLETTSVGVCPEARVVRTT